MKKEIKTWFGKFTIKENRIINAEIFKKEAIISELTKDTLFFGKIANHELYNLAMIYGFVKTREEYNKILHDIYIDIAKKKLYKAINSRENQIIKAIETIDELNEISNLLSERLNEYYIQYFGEKKDLYGKNLAIYINKENIEALKPLATSLLSIYETKEYMESFLKENMQIFAPCLTKVAGYILGARLLRISKNLESLAKMPSSRIQVIGANNSLFKHLKGKATSPKHGLIFRHPSIKTAPKKLRGKIARALASKISLAARYDFYSDGYCGETLIKDFEKKITYIKK